MTTPPVSEEPKLEWHWRCDVTGNIVGTDTEMIGAPPCQCQGHRAAAMDRSGNAKLVYDRALRGIIAVVGEHRFIPEAAVAKMVEAELRRLRSGSLAQEGALAKAAMALVKFVRGVDRLDSRGAGIELTRLCREIDDALPAAPTPPTDGDAR